MPATVARGALDSRPRSAFRVNRNPGPCCAPGRTACRSGVTLCMDTATELHRLFRWFSSHPEHDDALNAAADLGIMLDAGAINEDELWNALFDDDDTQVAAIEITGDDQSSTVCLLRWLLGAICQVRPAAKLFRQAN